MRDAKQIIEEIEEAGTRRAGALSEVDELTPILGRLFREARAHPEVEIKHAAEVGCISRARAYRLMESGRPDDWTKPDTAGA